jgi:hypothetical protein
MLEEKQEVTEFLQIGSEYRKFQVEPWEAKFPSVTTLYNSNSKFQLETFSAVTECVFNKLDTNLWPIATALRLLLASTINSKIIIYEWQLDAFIVLYLHCSLNKTGEIFKHYQYNSPLHVNCTLQASHLASLYQVVLVCCY